jgi:hypothetical protein
MRSPNCADSLATTHQYEAKQSATGLITLKRRASRRANSIEEVDGHSGIEEGGVEEGRCSGRRSGCGGGGPGCDGRQRARCGQMQRRVEPRHLAAHGRGWRWRWAAPWRTDTPDDRGGPGGGQVLRAEDGDDSARRSPAAAVRV